MDELTTAAEALDRAIRDRDDEAAGRLLDEDFVLMTVQPTPSAVSRSRFVEQIGRGAVPVVTIERRLIDVDEDCGSVLQRVRSTSSTDDTAADGADDADAADVTFVQSDLWRLRSGEWRLWRRHSTQESVAPAGDPAGRRSMPSQPGKAATVSEVAAVLAALSEGRIHGPNAEELSQEEILEYVEAFRALRLE